MQDNVTGASGPNFTERLAEAGAELARAREHLAELDRLVTAAEAKFAAIVEMVHPGGLPRP
jgi:hypothetical protein